MGQAHLPTVAANNQVGTCQSIMGSPAITSTRRVLSFWLGRHEDSPIYFNWQNLVGIAFEVNSQ